MFENLRAKREEIVAAGVALSAFAASAQHIFHVTEQAGNPALVAALHPAGIDGLIYIGIRAMQRGNRRAGGFAIAYGAAYSLAFNAASYGGFVMPVWALAACMPLAMFAAFLIVHGGHAAAPAVQVVTETVERVVEVLPQLLPIAPFQPHPVPSQEESAAPLPLPKSVAAADRRVARWDVEKAVAMILDGRTDAEIMDVVAVTEKPLQRTKRCVRMLQSGMDASTVATTIPLSLAHVQRVQAAMQDAS
jgi:hypothetical protein